MATGNTHGIGLIMSMSQAPIYKPDLKSQTPTGSKKTLRRQKHSSAKSKQNSTEPAPSPTPRELAMQQVFSVTEPQNGRHTFQSYQDLLTKLKQQFMDPNPRAMAMKKLMDTKQGTGDIQTYLMKVTTLVNDSDIGAIGGKAIIQAHMNQRSRTAFVYSTVRMTEKELMGETIENFCERAGQIIRRIENESFDNPLYAALRSQKTYTTSAPGHTPSPDTPPTATPGTTAPAQWTWDESEVPYRTMKKHAVAVKGYAYTAGKQGIWPGMVVPQARKDGEDPHHAHNNSTQSTGTDEASRFEDVMRKDEGTA
ncbi:MAG: hypothetical protein M1816_005897 [Peltula sp. TS41687]|nr:MAG: hypothetical protein M1816_005897 [Peltula sp. TS41687]